MTCESRGETGSRHKGKRFRHHASKILRAIGSTSVTPLRLHPTFLNSLACTCSRSCFWHTELRRDCSATGRVLQAISLSRIFGVSASARSHRSLFSRWVQVVFSSSHRQLLSTPRPGIRPVHSSSVIVHLPFRASSSEPKASVQDGHRVSSVDRTVSTPAQLSSSHPPLQPWTAHLRSIPSPVSRPPSCRTPSVRATSC